jgi:hypothetical protein
MQPGPISNGMCIFCWYEEWNHCFVLTFTTPSLKLQNTAWTSVSSTHSFVHNRYFTVSASISFLFHSYKSYCRYLGCSPLSEVHIFNTHDILGVCPVSVRLLIYGAIFLAALNHLLTWSRFSLHLLLDSNTTALSLTAFTSSSAFSLWTELKTDSLTDCSS